MADVPDWLTTEFLKSCLESDGDNFPEVQVTSLSADRAVPVGNNYGSNLLRVKVQYTIPEKAATEQEVSLIVKTPLTCAVMDIEGLSTMYEREPKYYNMFIAETYKLSKHDIVPKHYASPNPLCVVLEDLKDSGYKMIDRTQLLDMEHTKLYIQAAAKLHAFSIAISKSAPEMIEEVASEAPGTVYGVTQTFKAFVTTGILCMETYLEDNPTIGNGYLETISKLRKDNQLWKLYQKAEQLSREKALKAITQTDPWCANMMFKYDEDGRVIGIKLLDFQLTRLRSPVFEFVSFVWACVDPEVRGTELHNLYRMFCDVLNENLASLGCHERLTLDTLKQEALELSPVVMMVVSSFLPEAVQNEGITNMDDFLTKEVSKEEIREISLFKMHKSPGMARIYKMVLQQLDHFGVFEYLKQIMDQS